MVEIIEQNGAKYVSALQLHSLLGIKKYFAGWVKYNLERTFATDMDFYTILGKSTGGRPVTDYLLKENKAIEFIIMSGGVKAKDIRNAVINAFKEKQTGILLNADQVSALTDLVKAMTLVSVQNKAESSHYNYLNKPAKWWKYRAELLGYSTESLKSALHQINKTYKSQKQALMHIDPSEIIRTGVVDLLIALGRNQEYALNVAEFAKIIAEKNGYYHKIWDDTKPNPLGLNLHEIIERQKLNPLK